MGLNIVSLSPKTAVLREQIGLARVKNGSQSEQGSRSPER